LTALAHRATQKVAMATGAQLSWVTYVLAFVNYSYKGICIGYNFHVVQNCTYKKWLVELNDGRYKIKTLEPPAKGSLLLSFFQTKAILACDL
jgi:hypothetical protein